MPEIHCSSCGIVVQPIDHFCLKCGAALGSTTGAIEAGGVRVADARQETQGECEKCGRHTTVKYYQFLYAVKPKQATETKPTEGTTRILYQIGGQDGAWLCARHRWVAGWSQWVLPLIVLLAIPIVWLATSQLETRIGVSMVALLVALALLVLPLIDGLDNQAEVHAIALKKKRLMDQGWDSFLTIRGYQAWSKTTGGDGSTSGAEPTIELKHYELFLDKLCQDWKQTPDMVQRHINAFCAKCGAHFTDEALSHLYLMGPASSYRRRMGDAVVLTSTSQDGNMLRAGKCPACGCTQMKIRFKA